MPKDERTIDSRRKKERERRIQLRWTPLFTGKKRGSCLNCKAAKVSSGQEPGTQSGPRPVTVNRIMALGVLWKVFKINGHVLPGSVRYRKGPEQSRGFIPRYRYPAVYPVIGHVTRVISS